MSEWQQVKVSDVVEIIGGGTPKTTNPEFWNGDIPWLSIEDFNNDDRFVSKTVKTITNKGLEKSSTKLLNKGDLIISARGTVGKLAQLDKPMAFNQSCYGLRGKPQIINNGYLYYALKTAISSLQNAAHGAVFNTITRDTFEIVSIPVPSKDEQSEVEGILGSIDQKIELNQRMNETLEGMARAIFKSWFVDFDPVHAKAEGREPEGMDSATAALFPAVFNNDGLPEGWEAVKVEEVLKRSRVKNRYKKTDVDVCGETPVFEQGSDILLGYHNGIAEFQATPDKPMFIFGDHTCVTKLSCRPFDVSQNVIPLEGSIRDTIWTYYAVSELQKFEEYRRHWAELVAKQLCLPDENTTKAFSEHVLPLLLQKEHNEKQNQTLAALRDTLLPKLISGELRVDTATEKLKEAVG